MKKLIKNHFMQTDSIKGIVALQCVIYNLLMKVPEFYTLCHGIGFLPSKSFSKMFGCGDVVNEIAKTKNPVMSAIQKLLDQNEFMSEDDVDYIVDYLIGVVVFNTVTETRLSLALQFLRKIYNFHGGKNGFMNPFEGKSINEVFAESYKSEEFRNMLNEFREQTRSKSTSENDVAPLMKKIAMTAANLSNTRIIDSKQRKKCYRGMDEVDVDCEQDRCDPDGSSCEDSDEVESDCTCTHECICDYVSTTAKLRHENCLDDDDDYYDSGLL